MKLYIDSSVYCALFDEHMPSRIVETKRFFQKIRSNNSVSVLVSNLLLDELSEYKRTREIIEEVLVPHQWEKVHSNDKVTELANYYIERRILPMGSAFDAAHIALATIYEVDFIVSFNLRHMVNRQDKINEGNAELNLKLIKIVKPKTLEL